VTESERARQAELLLEELAKQRPPKDAGPEELQVYGEMYQEAAEVDWQAAQAAWEEREADE
jgi:hypothetical protein